MSEEPKWPSVKVKAVNLGEKSIHIHAEGSQVLKLIEQIIKAYAQNRYVRLTGFKGQKRVLVSPV